MHEYARRIYEFFNCEHTHATNLPLLAYACKDLPIVLPTHPENPKAPVRLAGIYFCTP